MKFRIKDMDGQVFEVSEKCEEAEKLEDTKLSDEELSAAEIKKLKKLIPHLDELLEILTSGESEKKEDFDADELEVDEEVKEDEAVTVEEEPIKDEEIDEDIEETKVVRDSKSSFGSISRAASKSNEDLELEAMNDINATWAKRYGGK